MKAWAVTFYMALVLWLTFFLAFALGAAVKSTPVPHPTATRRAAGLGRVPMRMIMNPDPSKKDKPWR